MRKDYRLRKYFFLACQVLFKNAFNEPIKTLNLGRLGRGSSACVISLFADLARPPGARTDAGEVAQQVALQAALGQEANLPKLRVLIGPLKAISNKT